MSRVKSGYDRLPNDAGVKMKALEYISIILASCTAIGIVVWVIRILSSNNIQPILNLIDFIGG